MGPGSDAGFSRKATESVGNAGMEKKVTKSIGMGSDEGFIRKAAENVGNEDYYSISNTCR
jgi:hypothetical protein